jgi:hypothetical protein
MIEFLIEIDDLGSNELGARRHAALRDAMQVFIFI